ncbi:phosphoribosylformylglycinamidine cyclo-ligase [Helcococcus kunzii]|uniref:Phosphoribosylformylglycinamidine cyclo-ligase n=1 Tax=Helcococcus kunzii ATCC 51366 TaxID=883114 RepID=H3NMF8_9FIRM|nr:phosphoribosylformylglycinamidine cyclo-ligase [Helcococcus kunzii]EHR35044.1 phosphoribosylformylglycinamidine cyclo-ligase [Helcococcus kunzii ATCC 51366]QUY64469.1 phosphoribosylformylglycinamidine cyclo-ligase [Helcococcus kunzii]QZO76881.1 phosphoribosylformylglycinamidine cyclo-ligase [Helcococcus kunzii]
MSKLYQESGVSLEKGYKSVERIKKHVDRTKNKGMMSMIGSFGGAFDLSAYGFKNPVLVSGTDGVGTKLKLAFEMDKHDTIGIDVVAMCVNDVLAQGAIPLFFLDYLAVGQNNPAQIEQIVKGVSDGCVQADMALVGGETAEMPGFYKVGEYDIAGFCVGAQEKELLVNSENTQSGQVVIGVPSSGFHSNGFSLVRKVISDNNIDLSEKFEDTTVGEKLLTPTRIYAKEILSILDKVKVAGIAHITGGGFYENLPRCLKSGLGMSIRKDSYEVPSIFKYIQEKGQIDEDEMYQVFNMGVGLAIVVNEEDAQKVMDLIEDSFILGEVTDKEGIEII